MSLTDSDEEAAAPAAPELPSPRLVAAAPAAIASHAQSQGAAEHVPAPAPAAAALAPRPPATTVFLQRMVAEAVGMCCSNGQWELAGERDGMRSYKCIEAPEGFANAKGEASINAPPSAVFDRLFDWERRTVRWWGLRWHGARQ